MLTGEAPQVADRIVALADDYAAALVATAPWSLSPEAFQEGLAGALLAFLSEAVTLVDAHE